MRTRVLLGVAVAVVLVLSFAGPSNAAEPWAQPAVQTCTQAPEATQAIADADFLKSAIFAASVTCTSNAQCPCAPPACYCVTSVHRCICNLDLCCMDGECP